MLRITAVSAGAVDYLVGGSGCASDEHEHEGADERGGAAYLQDAASHGEPTGRWMGAGMESLGLTPVHGETVSADDVRAVFGQLRTPQSPESDPTYLGRPPRRYRSPADKLSEALNREPVLPSPERQRELELAALKGARKAVAYYDFTFSAPKSVSVYWAALIAAGADDEAAMVAAAHERAVEIAVEYAESRVAYTRTGYHGRTAGGESVGKHEPAVGTVWTTWRHSTNRAGEPQLHTHAALLNRVATAHGHVGALDGRAFRAYKEAISTAYERALEQLVAEACGVEFALRGDGVAREIRGVDPELVEEASTRRAQVVERVEQLIAHYVERHGHEPDTRARKAMADLATLDTRVAKGSEHGPDQVARWAAARVERLEDMLDEVETAGQGAAGRERAFVDEGVVAAAIADVQARYAVWTVGNLAQALDVRLGPAAALGVAAADRPVMLEGLVHEALASPEVVRVSAPDPVAVPAELQRADGTSIYRRANGERYATVDQLSLEDGVVYRFAAPGAPRLLGAELEMLRVELGAAGLSDDQVDAVTGLVSSGRVGEVLIGPAGAGKSHTIRTLARVWREEFDQRVLAVAPSQIATQNLAGDGLEALNATRFLQAFAPDEYGRRRDRVRPGDLVVVDEAAMVESRTLASITDLVARAGGKVVAAGDQHQLGAVGAGGLFAHLAEALGAHELTEVHRFQEPWEAEASLQLRTGDHQAVTAYNDHGRLRHGTLEQMQEQASRAYLADLLAGKDTLLIVGTNTHAAELSMAIREDLIRLGRVSPDTVAVIAQDQTVSLGDRIQARLNDVTLTVDAVADGVAAPVTNRALYTVVGHDPATGDLLARDDRGATAHLPAGYYQEHVTLAYAVTAHAAQGVSVDTGHPIIDRDTTREALYPAATRGRERNILYLVTDRTPDHHDQEAIHEQSIARLADVLDRDTRQEAATVVREQGLKDAASLAMIATAWDAVVSDYARARHVEHLEEALGLDLMTEARREAGFGRLLRSLREAELRGHDPQAVVREAVEGRSLADAESVSDVLRFRVRSESARRVPEQVVDPRDWTTLAVPLDGPVGEHAQELAVQATDRQDELGRRVAEAGSRWATRYLGPVPDPGGAERVEWERRAAVAAVYRDAHNIPDDQDSLGAAPSREHVFHRKMWEQAREALGRPTDAVDPAALVDAELYGRRERWAREQEFAPEHVADALRETTQSAHERRVEAHLLHGDLDLLADDDPRREKLQREVDDAFGSADELDEAVVELEAVHESRRSWWAEHAHLENDARLAAEELDARGLPADRAQTASDREASVDEKAPEEPVEPVPLREPETTDAPAPPDTVDRDERPAEVRSAARESRERAAERRGREEHLARENEQRDQTEERERERRDAAERVPAEDEVERTVEDREMDSERDED